ncbi:response regulator [Novosphingobium sp. P6W]|nr:response regulator [Novosphingobium sp. P6W]KIS30448.1 hypothetical protein TQ38_22635 [Novosphingobium sp. P6W]
MTIEVLIVDDAPFVALDLEDTVFDAGFMALQPCGSVSGALALLDRRLPDCAILDINLADGDVFPVADRLIAAGVPIIFHSGISDTSAVRARYPGAYFCLKPCPQGELSETLRRATSGKAPSAFVEREGPEGLTNAPLR